MSTPNEMIVLLVTASNRVDGLDQAERTRLMARAIAMIRQLRAEQGAVVAPDRDIVTDLEVAAADAGRMSSEDWQRGFRRAADAIRDLQPAIEPEPALPTHRPDGGDGGNY